MHFGEPKARSPSLEDVYGDVESFFECGVFLRTQSEGSTSPFFWYTLFYTRSPTDPRVFHQRNPCNDKFTGFTFRKSLHVRGAALYHVKKSTSNGSDGYIRGRRRRRRPLGEKKNWHHGMPPWWDFLCFLVVFCFDKTSKCLQNDVDI